MYYWGFYCLIYIPKIGRIRFEYRKSKILYMHTPLKLLKLSNWLLHGCASTYKFDLYSMELTQLHSECISKDVMIRWNSPKVLQKVCKNQNWKIFLISTKESIIIIFSFFIGMVSILLMSVLNIYHKELFIYIRI